VYRTWKQQEWGGNYGTASPVEFLIETINEEKFVIYQRIIINIFSISKNRLKRHKYNLHGNFLAPPGKSTAHNSWKESWSGLLYQPRMTGDDVRQ
jgi:hypothetical protein